MSDQKDRGTTNSPGKPSQSEGDRETVDQSLEEKGLGSESQTSDKATGDLQNRGARQQAPEGKPSQAEGDDDASSGSMNKK